MDRYIQEIFHKLARLLRARVVICVIGLWSVKTTPNVAEWVAIICGMALGVSGIEEIRRGKNNKGIVKRNPQ